MLHPLGTKARGENEDLKSRLVHCHERIRDTVALCRSLGAGAGDSKDETVRTAERISRYFTRALPRHTEDEDLSLKPRLLALGDEKLSAALATMSAEHVEHAPVLARVVDLCEELAAAPGQWPAVHGELATLADQLDALMHAHLTAEESLVFPAVDRLDAAAQAAIMNEMEARRGH